MKVLLATLLLATPALLLDTTAFAQEKAGSFGFKTKERDKEEEWMKGAKKVIVYSTETYQNYIEDFKIRLPPVHGGDDAGMVNVFPVGAHGVADPIGALVITDRGYTHSWLRTTPDMADQLPDDFDLVLEATKVADKVDPFTWVKDEVTDWDTADLVEFGMTPPPYYPPTTGGFGSGIAIGVYGIERVVYDLTSPSGTPLGHLLVERNGLYYQEFWVLYGGHLDLLSMMTDPDDDYSTIQVRRSAVFVGSPSEFYSQYYYTMPTFYAAPLAGMTNDLLEGCQVLGNTCP